MSETNNPKEPNDITEEIVDSSSENDETFDKGSAIKKKRLMERLGLIKQVPPEKVVPPSSQESDAATATINPFIDEEGNLLDTREETDKHRLDQLSINEIYKQFDLESYETNTIFIIESFLKALPEHLLSEVKRQSILNLIAASRMDMTYLLKDGMKRLDALDKYYQNFSATVDAIIATNERHIRELEEQISYHKKLNDNRKNIKNNQKSEIESEVIRIRNIIHFVQEKNK
jgi:hypothetical protein